MPKSQLENEKYKLEKGEKEIERKTKRKKQKRKEEIKNKKYLCVFCEFVNFI